MVKVRDKSTTNSFVPLGRELRLRLVTPCLQVSFWAYLLLGIILCGGVAIWVEVLKYLAHVGGIATSESIRTAINAYFPAIGCAAAVQLAFASENKKYLLSFSLLIAALFAAFSLVVLFLQKTPVTRLSFTAGIVGSLLAVLTWWIANGLESTYQDTVDPDAAVGGTTQATLPGDTSDFKT